MTKISEVDKQNALQLSRRLTAYGEVCDMLGQYTEAKCMYEAASTIEFLLEKLTEEKINKICRTCNHDMSLMAPGTYCRTFNCEARKYWTAIDNQDKVV